MSLEFTFKESYINTNILVENQYDLFEILTKPLYQDNLVKESFIGKVVAREKTYPTGIPTANIGVAIPHTDSEHVNSNAISVGVLKNPITFKVMASPEQTVEVSLVFLLAIKDPKHHINLLKNIMGLLKDETVLSTIINSNDNKIIFNLLNSYILEGL
ncbi:PTS sugar transporter subunit IIA [Caldibacillus thermoamylovorans]|uniref:PTS sugar transporter subunit IIA n=1 Tax=Caldibacillus thermoamylovorans TaxID=35841 RepID=UPI0022E58941|nr:PTS sugar transporter subunit IIA [Caldibacillus thermoamylovorans]